MKPVHCACVLEAAATDAGDVGLDSCAGAANADAKTNTTKTNVVRRTGFLLFAQTTVAGGITPRDAANRRLTLIGPQWYGKKASFVNRTKVTVLNCAADRGKGIPGFFTTR
jgi:hypothetical protein